MKTVTDGPPPRDPSTASTVTDLPPVVEDTLETVGTFAPETYSRDARAKTPHQMTHESVIELLSDAEVTRMNAGAPILDGEEFIDLARPDLGVQRGPLAAGQTVLARKSVHPETWARVVQQLAGTPAPKLLDPSKKHHA